jgi:hypothetical protein
MISILKTKGMMWKGQNRGEPARNAAVKQFIQELHP